MHVCVWAFQPLSSYLSVVNCLPSVWNSKANKISKAGTSSKPTVKSKVSIKYLSVQWTVVHCTSNWRMN